MKEDLIDKNSYRKKCLKCHRPSSSCMCKYTSALYTKTHFVFLMHPMEFKKEKNGTGRLCHLQLKNSRIIMGIDFTHDKEVNELIKNYGQNSYILYPGQGSINLSSPTESQTFTEDKGTGASLIFIIDGTWPCAKKMIKLSHNLQKLQKISFDNSISSQFILKQQPNSLCLSTIESVKILIDTLIQLKQENIQETELEGFLLPFKKMIEYQTECVNDPTRNKYRTKKDSKLKKKEFYKSNPQRNIFFVE